MQDRIALLLKRWDSQGMTAVYRFYDNFHFCADVFIQIPRKWAYPLTLSNKIVARYLFLISYFFPNEPQAAL